MGIETLARLRGKASGGRFSFTRVLPYKHEFFCLCPPFSEKERLVVRRYAIISTTRKPHEGSFFWWCGLEILECKTGRALEL